jgi:hypothetical protein
VAGGDPAAASDGAPEEPAEEGEGPAANAHRKTGTSASDAVAKSLLAGRLALQFLDVPVIILPSLLPSSAPAACRQRPDP